MMPIVINNQTYLCPDAYKQLSVAQAQTMHQYKKTITQKKHPNAGTRIGQKILCQWAHVPREVARKVNPNDIYLLMEALSSRLEVSEKQKPITSFAWGNKQLQVPKSSRNEAHHLRPLATISAAQFCRATDLFLADALQHAHLIVALLCLPQGEAYDELKIEKRAQTLKEIPFCIAQQLFQQLKQTHQYLQLYFPQCYQNQKPRLNQVPHKELIPKFAGWYEMLFWLANYTPSEIKVIERMNLYTCVHLLECRLKNHPN